jgi:hypothetical protein
MDKQNDTLSIFVLRQGRSSMEERHLEDKGRTRFRWSKIKAGLVSDGAIG